MQNIIMFTILSTVKQAELHISSTIFTEASLFGYDISYIASSADEL